MFRRIALCAAVLLLGLSGPATHAQDSSSVYSTQRPAAGGGGPLQWLLGGRAVRPDARVLRVPREARPRSYEPRRRSTPVYRPAIAVPDRPPAAPESIGPNLPHDPAQPQTQTADTNTPVVAPAPAAPPLAPVTVAVIGDSLSVFLAQGLQETYADRPSITFLRRNREASGLVRTDYYDWPKQLRDLIATTPRIDAIVIEVGSNDRQQLRDEAGVHEPRTERWNELYAKRIDEIIAIVREKRIPLIWAGLPAMRGERYSADVLAFNQMFKVRTQAAGVAFIDIWEAFSGESGGYSVNGPDVDGTIVRLRTADGVHFTRAGARKFAWFVDKELQKIVAAVQDKAAPRPAMPPVVASAPTPGSLAALPGLPELPLPPALRSNDALLGVALPDAPLAPTLRPRPEAGAVERLNAPPASAGGALLDLRDLRRAASPEDGQPRGGPKAGRSDDFRLNP